MIVRVNVIMKWLLGSNLSQLYINIVIILWKYFPISNWSKFQFLFFITRWRATLEIVLISTEKRDVPFGAPHPSPIPERKLHGRFHPKGMLFFRLPVYKRVGISRDSIRIDSLQSAFSLKIRLLLISSSATANHDVIITIRDWDTPSFLAARGFAARVVRFRVQ